MYKIFNQIIQKMFPQNNQNVSPVASTSDFEIIGPGSSGEAKHSNRSCYANLQLSRTIKTIVNLHSMTCCYA